MKTYNNLENWQYNEYSPQAVMKHGYITFFSKIKLPLVVIMSLQPVEVPVFVMELTFSHKHPSYVWIIQSNLNLIHKRMTIMQAYEYKYMYSYFAYNNLNGRNHHLCVISHWTKYGKCDTPQ